MKVPSLCPRALSAFAALFCLLILAAPHAQAQNSFTYPPFPAANGTSLQWNGSASITGGVLQLTAATGSQNGSAWYTNPAGPAPAPLPLVNGFSTTFTFQFTQQGGENGSNGKPGADGIAFVVQNGCFSKNNTCGVLAVSPDVGTGGEIGFSGLTHSVAVQFDTWCNAEYHDTCATNDPYSSADQVTVESCGAAANTVNHSAGCSFGTVDLSTFGSNHIYLADETVHTATINYVPPPGSGACSPGSTPGSGPCGTLTVILDSQTILAVPFNIAYLGGLDSTDDAYVGFTGATGGSYEVQDVLSWNFGVTVVQQFNTTGTTTASFSTPTSDNTLALDLSSTNNNLICNTSPTGDPQACPTSGLSLVTTNQTITTATWPQFVIGTPWGPSTCAAVTSNGGSSTCTMFVNACYGGIGGILASQASDYYCPMVSPTAPAGTSIVLNDTFTPPSPLPPVPLGTTVSLLDFTPSSGPTEVWGPSNSAPNPVCTNPFGGASSNPTFQCDVADTIIEVFGDQTTTRGSKPKKGWIVSVLNVPMLLTTWEVITGSNCPTSLAGLPAQLNYPPANTNNAAATEWFNGNCVAQFTVNPATAAAPNNGFVAAPPALITYGQHNVVSPVLPPTTPADVVQNNSSAGMTTNPARAWVFSPGTLSQLVTSIGGTGDGSYILHWSAQDLVGNSEKNVQVIYSPSSTPCLNPNNDHTIPPTPGTAGCYIQNLYTTTLNIDSVNPTASCTPPSTSVWYKTDITAPCTGSDDRSGIGSATPGISGVSPTTPIVPPATVSFNLATTVGATAPYWSNSAMTGSQQLCDLAGNCFTEGPLGPYMIDEVPPTIPTLALSPSGGVYTVGQKVSANFTCADVGSGVASCLGTGGITSGGLINTSVAGQQTFTVTATDVAGNVTTTSINYTVTAPSADVALFEQPGAAKRGTTFDAVFWALDLSTNTASNVAINATLTFPAGVLGGNVSAIAGIVSCTLAGCNNLTSGTSCTATNTTVSCNIGSLPSVFKITGAAVKIMIPISSTATVGSKFTVTGTVTSANDPNPKNNTASQTFTVSQ
jgi:Bacterial lectin